jgi:UrcA family protein
MNAQVKIPNRSRCDSPYSKLALMALSSLVLIVAIGKQLPASAADQSAVVSLADLDLSTDKGMQTARDRIHQTAQQLCGKVVNPWSLSHHPDYVRCVDDATAAAMGQLNGPLLAANANSRGQGSSTP